MTEVTGREYLELSRYFIEEKMHSRGNYIKALAWKEPLMSNTSRIICLLFPILAFASIAMTVGEWEEQYSPTTYNLLGVHFPDSQNGWIAGDGEIILHTGDGGSSWIIQYVQGQDKYYSSIFFADSLNGWVCGTHYTMRHTEDGGWNWDLQLEGGSVLPRFHDVWFLDALDGWAVADDGIILHTPNGGSDWAQKTSGTTQYLFGVCFGSADTGYVVGGEGIILRTIDGDTWESCTTPTDEYFYGVGCYGTDEIWAVGSNGTIVHSGNAGESWASQTSGSMNTLFDVGVVDQEKVWICGDEGTFLYTSNGGATWENYSVGGPGYIYSISMIDEWNGWAVGEYGRLFRYTDSTAVESPKLTEINSNISVEIDGNPISNALHLDINMSSGSATLRLFDLTGRCNLEAEIPESGMYSYPLDCTDGAYLLVLDSGSRRYACKVMVIN
ncbi:hypothetical protein GF402_01500 [Candidatus Fermentibacteria bacterium]|nr:hypothetical protein [Candidatus Fermentibacteria bacterium]